jgi:uncharacterized protein affecting Mg2+/Co2+ transport
MELKIRPDRSFDIRLKAISEQQSKGGATRLNELVYKYTESIIKKKAKKFDVTSVKVKGRRAQLGSCYGNAAELCSDKKWDYVEGIAIKKNTGQVFCHAWNIDENGRAVDVTFSDAQLYEYFGIVIPFGLIFEIGRRIGGIWYCSLPYLKF